MPFISLLSDFSILCADFLISLTVYRDIQAALEKPDEIPALMKRMGDSRNVALAMVGHDSQRTPKKAY